MNTNTNTHNIAMITARLKTKADGIGLFRVGFSHSLVSESGFNICLVSLVPYHSNLVCFPPDNPWMRVGVYDLDVLTSLYD